MDPIIIDTFFECLIGGAMGDALGYPLEFMDEDEIRHTFGASGIQTLEQARDCTGELQALISDDTQMVLFTAAGVIRGLEHSVMPDPSDVWNVYKEWISTQGETPGAAISQDRNSLASIPALNVRRAPDSTCLSALSSGVMGTPEFPINESKGCACVARVAPIGLLSLLLYDGNVDEAAMWAADFGSRCAAITHGHPLGWLSAGLFSATIARLAFRGVVEDPHERRLVLWNSLISAIGDLQCAFPYSNEMDELINLMVKAIQLGNRAPLSYAMPKEDFAAMHELGKGCSGEEALAMAIYACLAHVSDFGLALRCAVNHGGNSSSIGTIAGNLLGTLMGREGRYSSFKLYCLEQFPLIEKMALRLRDFNDPRPYS